MTAMGGRPRSWWATGPVSGRIEVLIVAFGAPELLDGAWQHWTGSCPWSWSTTPPIRRSRRWRGATVPPTTTPGTNLGFAAGVNFGMVHRLHPESDLLLLNPDAQITPDGIDALEACLYA